ncbi:hypothetical protein X737_31950 [Mesorhizobium sp. L48C026A00]|nr:hypothetical protein X737_31950 [Mesorhizobium sp. L48C026A00]
MTPDAHEFIRRFLLHTLPDGFHRIRHYGFLANGNRAAKLSLCHRLLAGSQQNEPEPDAESAICLLPNANSQPNCYQRRLKCRVSVAARF